MKQYLLAAIITLGLGVNAQNLMKQTRENWMGNVWEKSTQKIIQYDNNNLPLSIFNSNWEKDAQKWTNNSNQILSYDANGNTTETLSKTWNTADGIWVNNVLQESTYTSLGKIDKIINYVWKNQNWQNSTQIEYSYNSKGLLTGFTKTFWDETSSNWKNDSREIYAYNSQDELISKEIQINDSGTNQWMNVSKNEIFYNNQKLEIEKIGKSWNNNLSAWEISFRLETTYNSLNQVSEVLSQSWDQSKSAFVNKLKEVNSFNENNIKTESNYFEWDNVKQNWYGSNSTMYTLNGDGTIKQSESKYFHTGSLVWINSFRVTNTYDNASGLQSMRTNKLAIYPNPVQDKLHLIGFEHKAGSFEITALDGKNIYSGQFGENEQSIDLNSIPNGIYLVKITCQTEVFQSKIVKN